MGVGSDKDITVLIKCPEGKTSVEIPKSVTYIGNHAFHNCSNLTSIKIPESVTYIGDHAFHNCSNLISVKIPGSVTEIGNSAFSDCSNLISIKIPESVTTIGYGAFDNCLSLTAITVDIENKAYVSVDGVLYNKDTTELIADPTYKMQSGTTESESDF